MIGPQDWKGTTKDTNVFQNKYSKRPKFSRFVLTLGHLLFSPRIKKCSVGVQKGTIFLKIPKKFFPKIWILNKWQLETILYWHWVTMVKCMNIQVVSTTDHSRLRAQSFTSLMADLHKYINRVSSFSRCLKGIFPPLRHWYINPNEKSNKHKSFLLH